MTDLGTALTSTPQRASILLVGDPSGQLASVGATLESSDYDLVVVPCGSDAISQMEFKEFAVVVIDVRMLDALTLIQGQDRSSTPIICVAPQNIDSTSVERGYASGAVDFWNEPLSPLIVRAKIRVFVDLFRQKQQAKYEAKRLREQQRELLGVTDQAPVLLAHCDSNGRYKFVNKGYAARFGLTTQDLVGKTIQEIVGKQAYANFGRYVDAALAGEPVEFEVEIPYEQIGPHIMHCTYAPEFDGSGQVAGFVAVITDVTQRKRAEEALLKVEQRFARFMQHLPGLAWIKDTDGRYVYANDAAVKAFATTRSELYGTTDDDVFPPETAAQFKHNDRLAIYSGSGVQVVEELKHEDGSLHYSLVSKFPLLDSEGQVVFVGGMAIDITEQKRIEQALRQSEARFRGLMEQAPFSIQVFSPDGRTIRVNQAWEELWGIRFEQIVSYNVLEDRQLEERGILQLIHQGFAGQATRLPAIPYNPNETIPNATDEADPTRWISAVIYPIKDVDGIVREVILVHEDITARRRAEEKLREAHRDLENRVAGRTAELVQANEFMKALLENVQTGIVTCDAAGVLKLFNNVTRAMHGLPEEAIPSDQWPQSYSIYQPDGETLMPIDEVPLYRALQGERVRDAEMVIAPLGQHPRTVLASGQAFYDAQGVKLGAVVSMHDITARKQAEEALRKAHAELERRVQDRTLELAHANQALLDADRRKDEFLATLAHELRNPLAPIHNSLQILKMPGVDASTIQQTREMMERQVHHLVRLVDDLLDVSRVMRGKIELRREPIELATIIGRAFETAKPLIEVQNHQVDISVLADSLLLDADPVRMAQVVGNLLTNAAKYTEPNGHIWLVARSEGDHAVLSIRDSGIGIAPHMLPHIFDLFVQVDHTATRSQGGLGIGLTLVKNLVEMHGGSVEAHSDGLGKGCEFLVRLPLSSSIPKHVTKAEERDQGHVVPPSGLRLLVVDDTHASSVTGSSRLTGVIILVCPSK